MLDRFVGSDNGRRRTEVKSVHRRNLEQVLEKLGVLASLDSGNEKCHVCTQELTRDNLGLIFKRNDKVYLCCDKPSCLKTALEHTSTEDA